MKKMLSSAISIYAKLHKTRVLLSVHVPPAIVCCVCTLSALTGMSMGPRATSARVTIMKSNMCLGRVMREMRIIVNHGIEIKLSCSVTSVYSEQN